MVTVEGSVVVATCGAIVCVSWVWLGEKFSMRLFRAGGSSSQGKPWADANLASIMIARSRKLFLGSSLIMMASLFSLRIRLYLPVELALKRQGAAEERCR